MERQNDGTNDADALSRPPRAGDDPPSTDKEHPPSTDHEHVLPRYNFNGDKVMKGIRRNGESGRKGFHPLPFLRICYHSTCSASKLTNWLWPAVPAAIAVHFALGSSSFRHNHLIIFILNYVAMLPTATLLGFAGQELARKLPKVWGVITETTLCSVVEIILFIVLLVKHDVGAGHNLIPVIKAAILGSILANLLLCLGLCFFVGGMRRDEQTFDEAVSETGSALLGVAGMGLLIPAAFWTAVSDRVEEKELHRDVLSMSRFTCIFLLIAFGIYMFFQLRTHHTIYDDILAEDEEKDAKGEKELRKPKLTLTECIVALVIAVTCVSLHATFLVLQIHYVVKEYHVRDAFVGLILVPLAEKAAEHLNAIDEAWNNKTNFALAHVLGATIQTALLNAPLVVIIGWGLQTDLDLNFEAFMIVMLILAIFVVGNFLRDGKSNYLEGSLCVIVYIIIAVAVWFYPDPPM